MQIGTHSRILTTVLTLMLLLPAILARAEAPASSKTEQEKPNRISATEDGSTAQSQNAKIEACHKALEHVLSAAPPEGRAGYICSNADARSGRVYLKRSEADRPEVRSAVNAARSMSNTTIEVILVNNSSEELLRRADLSRLSNVQRQQVMPWLVSVGVDIAANSVRIETLPEAPWDPAALAQTLGVAVTRVNVRERPRATNRYSDTPPHWGGARILAYEPGANPTDYMHPGVYRGACTSGFPATYNSTSVMVTAGHCAPYYGDGRTIPTWIWAGHAPGLEADNFICQSARGCPSVDGWFGRVWQTNARFYDSEDTAQRNPSRDVALIANANYEPWMWVAASTNANGPFNHSRQPART